MEMFRMMLAVAAKPTPPPPPAYWLDVNRTDGLAESDRVALEVFFNAGLCSSLEYMTEDEAAAVVDLPSFNVTGARTGLINWDWSKLTNIENSDGVGKFANCAEIIFTNLGHFGIGATSLETCFANCMKLTISDGLPVGFGSNALSFRQTFSSSGVSFTELPEGCASKATTIRQMFMNTTGLTTLLLNSDFGAVATNYEYLFYRSSLKGITLNPVFGVVATNMNSVFDMCASLEVNELNAGFGINALTMRNTFAYNSKLKLLTLPEGFASKATDITGIFQECRTHYTTITSINSDFGAVATNWDSAFANCFGFSVHHFPPHFASTATNMRQAFTGTYRVDRNIDTIYLVGDDFGQHNTNYYNFFTASTYLKRIEGGKINISGIVNDTIASYNGALKAFATATITHVLFAGDLKFTIHLPVANLINIDNESLFSMAVCLHDWWNESAGDFVGNEGKTFGVTQLQKNTLDANDYESGYSYSDYIADKGWDLTIV